MMLSFDENPCCKRLFLKTVWFIISHHKDQLITSSVNSVQKGLSLDRQSFNLLGRMKVETFEIMGKYTFVFISNSVARRSS